MRAPPSRCSTEGCLQLAQAAVCLSGQAGLLGQTYPSMLDLNGSFASHLLDFFLFVSKPVFTPNASMQARHPVIDSGYAAALEAIRPVRVMTYDASDYRADAPLRSDECYCNPAPVTVNLAPIPALSHFSCA